MRVDKSSLGDRADNKFSGKQFILSGEIASVNENQTSQ